MVRIDPWNEDKINKRSSDVYKVDETVETFHFINELSECYSRSTALAYLSRRTLPTNFNKFFEERSKMADTIVLDEPIFVKNNNNNCNYFNKSDMAGFEASSSSFYMASLMERMDATNVSYPDVDLIITSGTLRKISGTIFQPEKSWDLRAYREIINNKPVIIVCDNDTELKHPWNCWETSDGEINNIKAVRQFAESISIRSPTIDDDDVFHVTRFVTSTLKLGNQSMRMLVAGEIDMLAGEKAINGYVVKGCSRTCRVSFTNQNFVNTCFEYLWARSFWIGVQSVIFGVRRDDREPIQTVQRFGVPDFHKMHCRRNNYTADLATTCVAKTLFKIREMFECEMTNINVTVDFLGKEGDAIRMHSVSRDAAINFWLVRQKYYLKKHMKHKAVKKNERKRVMLGGFPKNNKLYKSDEIVVATEVEI